MKKITLLILLIFIIQGCSYKLSFTGGSTGDAETIQIDYFPNNAVLVEPTVSQKFTDALRDLFTRQTNLSLTTNNGDLYFEGEITDYKVIPITATADQRAAQNRLTIAVRVRFYNKLIEEDNFEKTFSFFSDFDANSQLIGGVLDTALEEIFERLTQDIYNASVAKW
ncbi:LptE family protein [Aureibaculum conchae]|uniref:LptE family protein n=1 Tax=Aureibaculum sp. 2308TA14-22 TaxID=3108392 RepID=UPI0033943E33